MALSSVCISVVELFVLKRLVPTRSSDDMRRVAIQDSSEFLSLAGVQFLLYVVEQAAPEYDFASWRLDHVRGGMLSWVSTSFVNVLNDFGFSRTAEKMHMDVLPVPSAFYRVTEVDSPRRVTRMIFARTVSPLIPCRLTRLEELCR